MMNSTQLHEFIRSRRSVRRFSPEAIEDDVLKRLLNTATHAPSAHNRQPWRFVVITTEEHRSKLAEAMKAEFARDMAADGVAEVERVQAIERSRQRITSAPAAILLCCDMSDMDEYPDDRRSRAEHTMAVQSVSNAGATLLLAAHAEGLGGVWICAPLFAPESVATALELPASWEPQALLLIGRPTHTPPPRPRRELAGVALYR
ncbi:MAG TPA: nitroreductase family protein [Anaerolineales bacterium]|nr:nitroreductase family protein [Anaerolineales bacterium]